MLLSHDITADWLRTGATLQYRVVSDVGAVLLDWTGLGVVEQQPYHYIAANVVWDGARDVTVFWKDGIGGTAEEYWPAGTGSPFSTGELDRPSAIIQSLLDALASFQVNGAPVFTAVGTINDVESFIREADPIRTDGRPVCGIVEGTIDQREGNTTDEEAICHLPFEILVRFKQLRKPGELETAAMQRAKYLLEAAKSAIMADRSRGGNAGLVQWQGDVINGTTVKGIIRSVTRVANEAFFTAAMSGACAWTKYRQPE